MNLTDIRMLEIPNLLKESGYITRLSDFYDKVGISRQHYSNVRNQSNYNRGYHFTAEQVRAVCENFAINANWIMGIEENWHRSKNTKKAQILEHSLKKQDT